MILTMSGLIIVSGIIYYNKMYILKHIINIMYIMIIKGIDIYSYLAMNIIKYLPSFIYVQTFTYKSYINENGGCELDFDIIEYKCNFNQRFYMVRFINLDDRKDCMYNFTRNINKRIEDRNVIFHSSIQKKNEYVRDVTEELRSFFHYMPFDEKSSSKDFIYKLREHDIWKYIKINIGLDEEHQLLVSLNDINLTDILIE
jgi:hypothetical protein